MLNYCYPFALNEFELFLIKLLWVSFNPFNSITIASNPILFNKSTSSKVNKVAFVSRIERIPWSLANFINLRISFLYIKGSPPVKTILWIVLGFKFLIKSFAYSKPKHPFSKEFNENLYSILFSFVYLKKRYSILFDLIFVSNIEKTVRIFFKNVPF